MASSMYHSELVKAGECEIRIMANAPIPSKFPPYSPLLSINFQNQDRLLNLENEDCAQALSGRQGQTLLIRAEGRDADAWITILEEVQGQRNTRTSTQPTARQERRQRRPEPARNSAPAHHEPARRENKEDRERREYEYFKTASRLSKQCGVLMSLCMMRAEEICADAKTSLSTEDLRTLAITLFIEMKGRMQIELLPLTIPSAAPSQPEPPREPEPRHEPERGEYGAPRGAGPGWAQNADGTEEDIPW